MLHVVTLVVLLTAIGWSATEFQPAPQPEPTVIDPDWRRTSEGWIKVGARGAAGLNMAAPNPAQDPALHPGVVAIFVLLAGVLSLMTFDRPIRAADAIAACSHLAPQDEAPAHG